MAMSLQSSSWHNPPCAGRETEVAQRDAMAFAGLRTGQKKTDLSSILSPQSWDPGFIPRELWGGPCWTSVYSEGGDMGQEVSTHGP